MHNHDIKLAVATGLLIGAILAVLGSLSGVI